MFSALEVVEHWDQHKDNVDRQPLEVCGSEIELKHRHSGNDLPVERGSFEGFAHIGAANGVVDDIKTSSARMLINVVRDLLIHEVDRFRAVAVDDLDVLVARAGREGVWPY